MHERFESLYNVRRMTLLILSVHEYVKSLHLSLSLTVRKKEIAVKGVTRRLLFLTFYYFFWSCAGKPESRSASLNMKIQKMYVYPSHSGACASFC